VEVSFYEQAGRMHVSASTSFENTLFFSNVLPLFFSYIIPMIGVVFSSRHRHNVGICYLVEYPVACERRFLIMAGSRETSSESIL